MMWDIGSLSNMVVASVSQQNEQLQCIEKFCHTFININDKKNVFASKNLYISHIETMENIVRLHMANANGSLEDISALASSNACSVEEIWDVGIGEAVYHHMEHERLTWSIDFSQLDPMKLASGSDDYTLKLWSINEKKSLTTIRDVTNVCSV
ncbi:unnamed protein product [Lactuca saligna]|uniref:Uncharacterized protein n=1 Tax=Lactuca saligna TaxID=75948 RepID=A0AA35Z1S3_LACSI|nr:unnamed protein product [Lactuca saligna]